MCILQTENSVDSSIMDVEEMAPTDELPADLPVHDTDMQSMDFEDGHGKQISEI